MKKFLFPFLFLIILAVLIYKFCFFQHLRLWNGKSQLNLVIQSQPIFVAALAPEEGKLTVLLIPDDIFVETIHGHGFYRVKSIFDLGQLKGGEQGGELLLGSLQEFLGVPLDGYLQLKNLAFKTDIGPEALKKLVVSQLVTLLKADRETNLSIGDLVAFWWQLRKIRPDKINLVDLSQTDVCSQTVLADGSQAMSVDTQRLDRIVNELFKDEKLQKESLTISVLNGTAHLGLAKKAVRLITNSGGRVVEAGDWQEEIAGCELKGEKAKAKTYLGRKLVNVFNCQWSGEDLAGHRADLLIIIGEDYWQKLNEP